MTSKTIIYVYHEQNDRVDSLIADISGSDGGACDICDTQEMTGGEWQNTSSVSAQSHTGHGACLPDINYSL